MFDTVITALAGADATKGELLLWMGVIGAAVGSAACVGYEMTRLVIMGVKAIAKAAFNR